MSYFDCTLIASDQSSMQDPCPPSQTPTLLAVIVHRKLATFLENVAMKTGVCMENGVTRFSTMHTFICLLYPKRSETFWTAKP